MLIIFNIFLLKKQFQHKKFFYRYRCRLVKGYSMVSNSISPVLYSTIKSPMMKWQPIYNGTLPKNHPWRKQAEFESKRISSDKLKIGCYILAGATLMGSLIYSVCTKKMTPSLSKNLDNTDEAACNMAMVGDFIDAIA